MLQENHLLYENDYFIIPMLHFLKVANRMFKRFFGGLCFFFPFSRCCFSQLFSALGPKGLLTFPQQCQSHDCVLLPNKN